MVCEWSYAAGVVYCSGRIGVDCGDVGDDNGNGSKCGVVQVVDIEVAGLDVELDWS